MRIRSHQFIAISILVALASIWLAAPAVAVSVEAGDLLVLLSGRGSDPLTRGIYRVDPEGGSWELVFPISVLPPPLDIGSIVAGPDGVLHLLKSRTDRSIVSVTLETGEYEILDSN